MKKVQDSVNIVSGGTIYISNTNKKAPGRLDTENPRAKDDTMAKYSVTHICGHEKDHQLYGKHEERYKRVDWLATQPCMDCLRKEEHAAAAKANADLPALEGSEKQIAWAETIRAKQIAELVKLETDIIPTAKTPEIADKATEAINAVKARTKASDWIDTRFQEYGGDWLLQAIK